MMMYTPYASDHVEEGQAAQSPPTLQPPPLHNQRAPQTRMQLFAQRLRCFFNAAPFNGTARNAYAFQTRKVYTLYSITMLAQYTTTKHSSYTESNIKFNLNVNR